MPREKCDPVTLAKTAIRFIAEGRSAEECAAECGMAKGSFTAKLSGIRVAMRKLGKEIPEFPRGAATGSGTKEEREKKKNDALAAALGDLLQPIPDNSVSAIKESLAKDGIVDGSGQDSETSETTQDVEDVADVGEDADEDDDVVLAE